MNRIQVTALLAFSTLVLPASIADGQAIFGGGNAAANSTSSQGNATGREDVQQCQAAPGGSRMRRRNSSECEAAAAAGTTVQQEVTLSLEGPQLDAPQCEATTVTEYSQRNTVTRVSGTINLANCPAGTTGTYNVVARVRDESGEIKPLEFNETWQTDAARNVPFNKDYPIGENVELVSVRVRNLKCTCAEAAQPAEAADAAGALAETAPN